jgi:hypothetical protein
MSRPKFEAGAFQIPIKSVADWAKKKKQSFHILSIYRIAILSVTLAVHYFHITLLPNCYMKYNSTRKDARNEMHIKTRIITHHSLHMRARVRMCTPTNTHNFTLHIPEVPWKRLLPLRTCQCTITWKSHLVHETYLKKKKTMTEPTITRRNCTLQL